MFHTSGLDLENAATYTDQAEGWKSVNFSLTPCHIFEPALILSLGSRALKKMCWSWERNPETHTFTGIILYHATLSRQAAVAMVIVVCCDDTVSSVREWLNSPLKKCSTVFGILINGLFLTTCLRLDFMTLPMACVWYHLSNFPSLFPPLSPFLNLFSMVTV